jgi:hypothetical protein
MSSPTTSWAIRRWFSTWCPDRHPGTASPARRSTPVDFAPTLPEPWATISRHWPECPRETARKSPNSCRCPPMVAYRTLPVTELKIPVSGVQFSPCPPFLFGSNLIPTRTRDLAGATSGATCADSVPLPSSQSFHRLTLMLWAQMRVSLRHRQRLVAQDFLHGVKVHPGHD